MTKTKPTVRQFAETWTRRFPRPDPGTDKHNARMIRPFVRDFGRQPLDAIALADAYEWGQAHPSHVRYVRTFYRDAQKVGEAETNPFAGLRIGSTLGRTYHDPPTEMQVRALELAAPPAIGGMVTFAAYTAIRLGETLGLRGDDFEGDVVRVERQRDERDRVKPLKGHSKPRPVLVPAPALEAVRTRLLAPGELWPLRRRDFYEAWGQARRATGIDIDWHLLRHFAGNRLIERGASARDVAFMFGHSSDRLVRRLYTRHVDERAAIDRLREVA